MEIEIIGVVRDAHYTDLKTPAPPTLYLPFAQEPDGEANFSVRTTGDATALVPAARRAIREIEAKLPMFDVRTQEAQVDSLFACERLFARLAGFFGAVALALVCVGLFGLMVLRRASAHGGDRRAHGARRDS